MECPRCRTDNPIEARFCKECDASLGGTADIPRPEPLLVNRGSRLAAKIIDAPFSAWVFLAAMSLRPFSWSGEIVLIMIMVGVVALPIQATLLSSYGQTIGKRALGIRIVRSDTGLNGGFFTNVFLRAFVNGLLAFIPPYVILDVLFILTRNRRCVHDYIAGTKVVRVQAR